jgi:ligand-binding sensor domain-containing protein
MSVTSWFISPLFCAAVALALLGVGLGNGCGANKGPSHARVDASDAVRAALAAAADARVAAHDAAAAQRLRSEPDWQLIDQHEVTALVSRGERTWAGTGGGVLYWERGALRERATALDGLHQSTVSALYLAEAGAPLYVGFADGACRAFERPESLRDARPCTGSPAGRVSAFVEAEGRVWAVSFEGGARAVDAEGDAPALATPPRAAAAVACGDGVYTAGLADLAGSGAQEGAPAGGLTRVDAAGAEVIASPPVLEALACDERGVLWAGGPSGLFRVDTASPGARLVRAEVRLPRPHVRFLAARDGVLWVGLATGQLALVRGGALAEVLDLPGLFERAALGEALWLGGGRGLVRLDEATGRAHELALPGPGSADISALAAPPGTEDTDRSGLAVGMFRRGVAVWMDSDWRRYDRVTGLPADEVNALAYDHHGALWVGTASGLGRIRDGVAEVVASPDVLGCSHVNALLVEGDTVLAATACGVATLDARSGALLGREGTSAGLPHRIVYDLVRWQGVLVAGTNDGLAVRDAADGARPWRSILAGRSALEDNWISALEVGADGELFVGTYGGGLYRGSGPDALARVEGPRAVNLTALARVGDEVWAGSLVQGAYALGTQGRQRRLEPGAHVLAGEVTAFAAWQGRVLVATRLGIGLVDG